MSPERPSADREKRERTRARWREWVLLDGHRGLVVALTVAALFAVLAAVGASGFAPMARTQPLFYAYSGLIGGNLTLITVVVSINQLLLSQQLGTPDQLRSAMEGTTEYRDDVEVAAGQVAPSEPLGFLRLLMENTRTTAQRLGGLAVSETDEQVYEELDAVVSNVTDQVDRTDALLQASDADTFDVLSTTLATNYARDVQALRRIGSRNDDRLPDHVRDAVDDLVDRLRMIDVARQYFKTVYLQQELARLSRYLFYVGLPAVAVLLAGLFVLTAPDGAFIPPGYLTVVVPATLAVGLLPLAVLFAFVLRVATVTRRTAAQLPFTTPAQERSQSSWEG